MFGHNISTWSTISFKLYRNERPQDHTLPSCVKISRTKRPRLIPSPFSSLYIIWRMCYVFRVTGLLFHLALIHGVCWFVILRGMDFFSHAVYIVAAFIILFILCLWSTLCDLFFLCLTKPLERCTFMFLSSVWWPFIFCLVLKVMVQHACLPISKQCVKIT